MKTSLRTVLILSVLSIIGLTACEDAFLDDFQTENPHIEPVVEPSDLELLQANQNETVHHFPNVDIIKEDPAVVAAMNDAWVKMLSLVVPYKHRTEIGFYIYYDERWDRFWTGPIVLGEKTDYNSIEPPSVDLGKSSNHLQVCAMFHCHTPYFGIYERPCGPSDKDKEIAQKRQLPGIVYDYTGMQPLDSSYPYYQMSPYPYTYGPASRPDIYY